MTGLPLQHFRRSIAHYASTPELEALLFSGTGLTVTDLAAPDFVLLPATLWQISDNCRSVFGPAWYLNFPALWSLDVQGQLESAMRFAPDLKTALMAAADHGHTQWGIVRWRLNSERDGDWISVVRNSVITPENWQMTVMLIQLNFRTILETAYPAVIAHLAVDCEGPAPLPAETIKQLLGYEFRWNRERSATFIPKRFLKMPSTLADATGFAAAIAGLEARAAPQQIDVSTRVSNLLGDQQSGQYTISDVAQRLNISTRTLARNLAQEGNSFRTLLDDMLKRRFARLAVNGDLTLATIAERLGYSDESALSRATRRWYGTTAAQSRRDIVALGSGAKFSNAGTGASEK